MRTPQAVVSSRSLHLFFGLTLSCAMVAASTSNAGVPAVQAASDIRCVGSSPLHDWAGKAPTIHSTLRTSALPGHRDGDLVIPVAGLDTDNASRDERMREMFHADQSPNIVVAIHGIDPEAVQRSGELVAKLTIGNTTHDVAVEVTNWKAVQGGFSFDAASVVSLRQFGLEAPSVLGFVRVADEVKIAAHVDIAVSEGSVAQGGEPR